MEVKAGRKGDYGVIEGIVLLWIDGRDLVSGAEQGHMKGTGWTCREVDPTGNQPTP